MKVLYIYHHLGLGDHVICNGLVRDYAKGYDKIYVFCKPHNVQNVEYMYRDNSNINILSANDEETGFFMENNPQNAYLIARAGRRTYQSFDAIIYNQAGLSIKKKWDEFYFKRDEQKERKVFRELSLKEKEYIFVHDDNKRSIDLTKLPKGIQIIKPDRKDFLIFDFLYVIEQAKEVHCINSSFFNMIDCLQLRNLGLFFHEYVRLKELGLKGTPQYKMNWKIC